MMFRFRADNWRNVIVRLYLKSLEAVYSYPKALGF